MALRLTRTTGFGDFVGALTKELASWREPLPAADGFPGGRVILPSRPLVHVLQDRLSRSESGALNVRIGSIDRLAAELGEPDLPGRSVPRGFWRKFLEGHLDRNPGSPLEPARDFPGIGDALFATIHELRMAGIDEIPEPLPPAVAARLGEVGKVAALARLLKAWIAELRDRGFSDRADLYQAAIRAAPQASARLQTGRALVLLPPFLHELQVRLLLDLGASLPEVHAWAVSAEGVELESLERTTKRLAEAAGKPEEKGLRPLSGLSPFLPAPASVKSEGNAQGGPSARLVSLSAPGPEAEAQEVVRELFERAEEVPFNKMAVLLRQPETYLPLLIGALDRAGIPFSYRGGKLASLLPEARAILALLGAAADDYPRKTLFQALSLAGVSGKAYTDDGGNMALGRWDRLTRQAGAGKGRQRLLEALDELTVLSRRKRDGDQDRALWGITDKPEQVEECRAGLGRLISAVEGVVRASTWKEAGAKLRELAVKLLPGSRRKAVVLRMLPGLSDLDAAGGPAGPEAVLEAVSDLFDSGSLSSGTTCREGVNILPISQAAGLDFEVVAIPGLALRRFPPPLREDPILLDREREALRGIPGFESLGLRWDRQGEEAWRFAAAVAGARKKLVLSFPGHDPESGRSLTPSPFLLRVHEAAEGNKIGLEALLKGKVKTVPVLTGFNVREPAVTQHDFDRQKLRDLSPAARSEYMESVHPGFRRLGSRHEALQSRNALSPWDGWISDPAALEAVLGKYGFDRSFSPTGLEDYAKCPYMFFLDKVLGLESPEEPQETEAREEIDPLHKGTIVHGILQEFHERLGKNRKMSERPEECRVLLEKIAEPVFDREEKAGTVGKKVLWEVEKRLLHQEMWACVKHDLERFNEFQPDQIEKERELCLTLPPDGGKPEEVLRIRGWPDRIDRSPDRKSIRIVDYKTGGSVKHDPGSFMGGKALQLPLYLFAALQEDPGADPAGSEAAYHYLSRKEGFQVVPVIEGDWERKRETLHRILRVVLDGIRGGFFPQNPGGYKRHFHNYENCGFCSYTELCGSARRRRMASMMENPPAKPELLGRFQYMSKVGKTWEEVDGQSGQA